jgi:hypothetical protein
VKNISYPLPMKWFATLACSFEVLLRGNKIYTFLGSCRRHGVNPFDYLKDLFTRLPAAKITQIRAFTPAAWAKAKASEKLLVQAA